MAGPEATNVNHKLRDGLASAVIPPDERIRWSRIENLVSAGIPDISFTWDGVDVWVESKWVQGKTSAAWQFSHPITGPQIAWHLGHAAAGGRSFIVARRCDTFRVWQGADVRRVRDEGFNCDLWLAEYEKPWSWRSILETLARSPVATRPGN